MPGMVKADNSSGVSPQRDESLQLGLEERGLWIIRLLYSCANAVASSNMECTNLFLEQLSTLASPTGDPMQRVASYFMEALAGRIIKCWPGVYRAMQCSRQPCAVDLQAAHKIFFNVCPFLKFAFLTVNQTIMDAMEGEKVVHLVGLEACDVVQWLALLQAFSSRPEGPPHLRITVVGERKEALQQMGQRLSEEAEKLDIPFQFHPVVVKLEALEVELLGVKIGEAVAVSSVMQLHCLLAQEENHCSIAGISANCRATEKVSSSRYGEENSLQKGGRAVEELQRETQHKSSTTMVSGEPFEMAGNGAGEGGCSLLQPWLDGSRGTGSKRSRDCDEADERELRRKVSIADVQDCSGLGSPSSTSASRDPAMKTTEPEGKESMAETINGGRNVFPLLEKCGTGLLQNGRSLDESFQPESNSGTNGLLRKLRSLYPKVMVVVEQEANHNGATLVERFVEALHYYSAMFDSMDSTLPQFNIERLTLEKHIFGQEIKNIVACEGLERVERHEKLERWRKRMQKAGFVPLQLSSTTMLQAERLLGNYPFEGYKLVDDEGCLTVCWHDTPIFSSSAWQV